ncbi:MAG: N-acyl-D-amino-acid deacylase family protein [Bryobacteraceae bacterium]
MLRTLAGVLFFAGFLFSQPSYDILIRGARVVDGTGNPWYVADVAIRGDTIAAVGYLHGATGRKVIDAKGLILTPGFIDIHSHVRHGLFAFPSAENAIRQGVTTVVEGNDGGSPLPLGDFLAKVARTPIALNFASFVGQGSVREKVIGLENRPATGGEIDRMKQLVAEAMRQGAFGLSSGLFYVPGNYSSTEEVIELARVAGNSGGMYISHIRDEAASVLDAVKETIRIGVEGGLPVQVTHHKIIGAPNWGRSADTLKLIDEARSRGVDVTLDQYPYTASNTGSAALFPQWAQAGGRSQLLVRLGDPGQRARIKAEIVRRIRDDRGGGDPKNVVMASCGFDRAMAGKSLAAISDQRGKAPTVESAAELVIEIQKKGGCSVIYHSMDERDLLAILQYPWTMIASDGGTLNPEDGVPHPRNYGTFARVLGRYVRDRRMLHLEEAVRKMTSLPANRLKIQDRGLIRPGQKADVALFDAAKVLDRATFENPRQYADGFVHVLVNGLPVLWDGQMTQQRPGRVLYGPARQKD